MIITSKSFQTDLWFHGWNGEVVEKEGYLVIRHPDNPNYLWGNMLYFQNAPTENDIEMWINLFRKEFVNLPLVKHVTISWDNGILSDSCRSLFQSRGFIVDPSTTLSMSKINELKIERKGLEIREVVNNKQWQDVIENQISVRQEHFKKEVYEQFFIKKAEQYKSLVNQGKGKWFVAYLNNIHASDLGIFYQKNIARVQRVATNSQFRRMKIASLLLAYAIKDMKKEYSIDQVIVSADPDYYAIDLYKKLGFSTIEEQYMIYNPTI